MKRREFITLLGGALAQDAGLSHLSHLSHVSAARVTARMPIAIGFVTRVTPVSSEAKLTRRQRIRLLTRLNRLTEANPIEAFSERGSPAHTELVAILRQLASPVVPSARA